MDDKLLDAAYPLVRSLAPGVSVDDWLTYARKARMRGGLLGLIGPEGTLFGMLAYRHEEHLQRGRILHVDSFITFELSRAAPGRKALCEAAEALARKHGCTAIEIRLDRGKFAEGVTARTQGWLGLGHSLESVVFVKSLDDAPGGVNRCKASVGAVQEN